MLLVTPVGLSDFQWITIIIVETIFLISLGILTMISLVKFFKKKNVLRLYVLIFLFINLIMFIQMVSTKFLVLNGQLEPENRWIQGFAGLMFQLTNLVGYFIYSEVFIQEEGRKKMTRIIYSVLVIIAFIIFFVMSSDVGELIFYIFSFILAIWTFVGFMVSSQKLMKRLDSKLDKISMKFLFFTGLSVILTLSLSMVNQTLIANGTITHAMSGLYLIYIALGLIPVFFVYSAFFQPSWLKKRYS